LTLNLTSREAAKACSCGRQPAEGRLIFLKSREAATANGDELLSPLRGLRLPFNSKPWADAQGYMLPPLRG
jgi:hypothetical protein